MEFSTKSGSPEKLKTACIVAGIFESGQLSVAAQRLDQAASGYLTKLLKRGDMRGRSGDTLLLHGVPGIAAERVLLVGLGREESFSENAYRSAITTAVRALKNMGGHDGVLTLAHQPVGQHDPAWRIRQAVMVSGETLYRFDQLKSKPVEQPHPLRKLTLWIEHKDDLAIGSEALQQAQAIIAGMNTMKDLANLPGNLCTPGYLAEQARQLAKNHGFEAEVLDRNAMEKLGMHSLLAVARGSHQPPQFIILRYPGGKKGEKPVVLVGKGVTFDSGGISLKPGPEMDEMKYDMSGAASVMAALQAAAMMRLPLNLIAVIPAVENMPGGGAARPGDVVTSLSGQTIEILNTDAEGRLILCDALTYVERFEPDCVVDVATLTGACVIALGHVVSGLLANDDALAQELLDAGQESWDRAWQMPLLDDYQEQLKSNFADLANIGGRPAGTITAAAFLSRFTEKYTWAHLDIAGTAWKSGKDKGSTGRPVPLLTHFLLARATRKQEKSALARRR